MEKDLICFCDKKCNLNELSSHYKKCEKFKSNFRDFDKKIATSIKRYVDKLNNTHAGDEDYINKLYLLDFFLMNYVYIVNDLIKKKDKNKNSFFYNLAERGIDPDLNIPSRTPSVDLTQLQMKISKENVIKINYSFLKNDPNQIKEKDEKDLIFEYCKNVYDIDPNFDKECLKYMEISISNITSRDCFVMVIINGAIKESDKKKNDLDKRIITCDSEDKKFYKFEYKDTYFCILLY